MAAEPLNDHAQLLGTGLVPIRTIARLTGVNPVTLRAWERRYGLIKPVRTPKGHRLYTMADVNLINRVIALLASGMSISQVGQVLSTDMMESTAEQGEAFDPWLCYQRCLIQAVEQFDEGMLNQTYNEALSLYPIDIITSHLIVPLLQELGLRWEKSLGSVAEEHFFSVFLRNKLGARFHHRSKEIKGPGLLASCLPEEQHEVALLLFALAASDRDYRVVLLGANTPLEELPVAVAKAGCQAIVLSGSAAVEPQVIRQALPELVQQVKVPVFIGGKVTERYAKELAARRVVILGSDFALALRVIDGMLRQR